MENTILARHRIAELISLNLRVQTGEHKTFLHYPEKVLKQANDPRLAFLVYVRLASEPSNCGNGERNTADYKLCASKYVIKT
jgi:hypothetical protein